MHLVQRGRPQWMTCKPRSDRHACRAPPPNPVPQFTAAGSVNDGNSGNNYTVTFVTDTTGADHGAGDHGDGGDEHEGLRRHDDGVGDADDHVGQPGDGRHGGVHARRYDTKNVGTGKTLTAAGSVNDGNSGNNYTVTFVTDTTGADHGPCDHGDGGDEHEGLRRHDDGLGDADDHVGQPGDGRHGGVHRDLRHQERGHGQDADGGGFGE